MKRPRQRTAARSGRRLRLEKLEARLALTIADPLSGNSSSICHDNATGAGDSPCFAPIGDQEVLGGAPTWLGIDGFDSSDGPLAYTVTSTNPSLLQAVITPATNQSLVLNVASRSGQPYGQMTFQLFDDLVPRTTSHIEALVNNGEFGANATFYRVAWAGTTPFVIQAGPSNTSSSLGKFDDEYHADLQFTSAGLLAMAKSNDDTSDAQIFVTGSAARFLDFNHSVFGVLTEGESVRQAIQQSRLTGDGPPPSEIVITSSSIITDRQNAALELKAAEGASGQADVTLTVTDAQGHTFSRIFHVTVTPDTANGAPFLAAMPATITAPPDQSVHIELHAIDVENNPSFFDAAKPGDETVPYTLSVNHDTGLVTITPPAGFTGSFRVQVGVRGATQTTTADQFDIQIIQVVIESPSLSVDLLPESDTGADAADNVTSASELRFRVSGGTDGALVQLYVDNAPQAQGTFSGSSIILSTTQLAALGQGVHSITATQTVDNVVSPPTPPLSLTIDSVAPLFTSSPPVVAASVGIPLAYDAQTSEEGQVGLRYSLSGAGGATIDPASGLVRWTPSLQQVGMNSVTITATDRAGNTTSQQFTICVSNASSPNRPPIAVNDTTFTTRVLPPNDVLINVLANDSVAPDVGETLTIVAVTQPASGGFTAIESAHGPNIRYRPAPGFLGTDFFTYTISDGRGGTATATVAVVVGNPTDANPHVGLVLQLTTLDGQPLTSLAPGQDFVLHVLAQDQSANPRGVFAAFLDLSWDGALAMVTGPLRYGSHYINGHAGDSSTAGLVDEGGAFASQSELGSGAMEVFSVPMRATATGTLVFSANPADQSPVHDVLVYGSNLPVPISNINYGTASVTVNDSSSLDVNLDGSVAPSDALIVITAINDQIALNINDGSLPQTPGANRLDVSNDGRLTSVDVLMIVNRLNELAPSVIGGPPAPSPTCIVIPPPVLPPSIVVPPLILPPYIAIPPYFSRPYIVTSPYIIPPYFTNPYFTSPYIPISPYLMSPYFNPAPYLGLPSYIGLPPYITFPLITITTPIALPLFNVSNVVNGEPSFAIHDQALLALQGEYAWRNNV